MRVQLITHAFTVLATAGLWIAVPAEAQSIVAASSDAT
jgi:hypothetical protein